jgi:hypothetical protein
MIFTICIKILKEQQEIKNKFKLKMLLLTIPKKKTQKFKLNLEKRNDYN